MRPFSLASSVFTIRATFDRDEPDRSHHERTADEASEQERLEASARHTPEPAPVQDKVKHNQGEEKVTVPPVQVAPIMPRPGPRGQAATALAARGEAESQKTARRNQKTKR